MASTLGSPENSLAWFINGDQLALVKKGASNTSGNYVAIDESVTQGLLVHYYGEPVPVAFDELDQYIDFPATLLMTLVDYIKSVLFRDRAGKAAQVNAELAQINMNLAATHERLFQQVLKRHIVALTTRRGGPRGIVPPSLRNP